MESNSDYETSDEEQRQRDTLAMIADYEKNEKKERRKNSNRNDNIGEVIIDPEMLKHITLSQSQMKKLKPKKERSERQVESMKKALDIRRNKLAENKKEKDEVELLKIKVAERKMLKKVKTDLKEKEKLQNELKELESDEEVVEKKPRSFQARKPKVEEEPEIDEVQKIEEKLNKANSLLNNVYYAQIMKSRGIKI
jgi:hypothetical protein